MRVVWGLRLALLVWTHRGNELSSYLGRRRGLGSTPPPYTFPSVFVQVGQRAVSKGKMLGGTTNGKPRSLGPRDTCFDMTVGVPRKILQPAAGATPSLDSHLTPEQPRPTRELENWVSSGQPGDPFHTLNLCQGVRFPPSPITHHTSLPPRGPERARDEASHSPLPWRNLCGGQEGGPSCRHQRGG